MDAQPATRPPRRRGPFPLRPRPKHALVAALVVVMTIAGAAGAVAATRTIETSTTLQFQVWVSRSLNAAFVSTRQEGADWSTHDYLIALGEDPEDETLLVSRPVSISVPLSVDVEADAMPFTPLPAPVPHLPPGEAPSGRASCCTVRGMSDLPSAQRAVRATVREVIAEARTRLGLTHHGHLVINIAYTNQGLAVRYRDAFGETLEELPSECTFQRGNHIFIGPDCRNDEDAIAREWLRYALRTYYVPARWVGVATFEYYWSLYSRGVAPSLRDDRYRSAIFHQPASDFREGRAHDDLMTAAALYALDAYGTRDDWWDFYQDLYEGAALHTVFETGFGVSLDRFYNDFELWADRQRAVLLSVAYASCEEAARFVRPRRSIDGGGFADYHVPLEYDHDGDGYVCEDYATFVQDEQLVCVVAGGGDP